MPSTTFWNSALLPNGVRTKTASNARTMLGTDPLVKSPATNGLVGRVSVPLSRNILIHIMVTVLISYGMLMPCSRLMIGSGVT